MRAKAKKLGIIIAAVAALGTVGGVALADIAGGRVDTGTSRRDAAVPRPYSGINDPSLQACMAAHQVCNAAALPELQTLPWSAPLPRGAGIVSRAQAEQFVRGAIKAPGTARTFSGLRTGIAAIHEFGINRNATTNETRLVWIVTVYAPVSTDGGPGAAPQLKQSYSAVVDAGSGQITDDCIGCAWLTSSK